jgi:selenide,water dikinase
MADPNLLVGFDTSDDAAVYRVDEHTALIQTVDFFPPMVDDPYLFGQVAAANALSDVYAMGGTPKLAMNLLCFPSDLLSKEDVLAILRGGADKAREAGAVLCGGHTIEDREPKYGLCVTGFVHPDRVLTNAAAQTGDALILTKPLGSGILSTAAKAGLLPEHQVDLLMATMTTLNAAAAKAMEKYTVHACTDITGFGLIGHATEMARGSGKTIRLFADRLPLMEGVLQQAQDGIVPGGAYRNREYLSRTTEIGPAVSTALSDICFDPQTSGGLLISLPMPEAERLLHDLLPNCPQAAIIGQVEEQLNKHIILE